MHLCEYNVHLSGNEIGMLHYIGAVYHCIDGIQVHVYPQIFQILSAPASYEE